MVRDRPDQDVVDFTPLAAKVGNVDPRRDFVQAPAYGEVFVGVEVGVEADGEVVGSRFVVAEVDGVALGGDVAADHVEGGGVGGGGFVPVVVAVGGVNEREKGGFWCDLSAGDVDEFADLGGELAVFHGGAGEENDGDTDGDGGDGPADLAGHG